MTFFSTR